MRAMVGDELVVRGRHVDDADRVGVIIEVHGPDGAPPYLVRWGDEEATVFYPTAGMTVERPGRR